MTDHWNWSWFTPYGSGLAQNEFAVDIVMMQAAEIDADRGTVSDTKRASWAGRFA